MGSKRKIYPLMALTILLFFGLIFKSLSPTPVPLESVQSAQTQPTPDTIGSAVVASVTDGDTINLINGQKIRLIGINAPENGQPYYAQAKEKLVSLVLGKSLTFMYDVERVDRYGRTLAYAYTGDVFINKQLIVDGVAVIDTVPPNVLHVDELLAAQAEGKNACNGIWSGLCKPVETACIQISAINPKGVLKNDEWLEFLNTCSEGKNLKGFLVKDSSAANSYVFGDITILAKATIKLHSGCSTNTATDIFWKCPENSNFIWNNSGDHAYLYDNAGKLISDVGY